MKTWRTTWNFIRNRPWLFILNACIWGTLHSMRLLPGWLTREVFNKLTGEASVGWNLWTLVALVVVVGVARFANLFAGLTTYVPFRTYVSGTLRLNMMENILRRPGAAALPGSPGEAVSRFRGDVERVMFFVSDWMVDFMGVMIGAVAGLIILLRINATITTAVIVPLLIVITLSNLMRQRFEYYREQERKAAGRVTGFIGEMYGAVQAVKVANAYAGVGRHFARLNEKRRQAALKDSLFLELLRTSFFSTIEISTGLILLLAGQVMANGTFTVGDFALFVAYLFPITDGVMYLGEMMANQSQTNVSVARLEKMLQGAPAAALTAKTAVPLRATFPPISYTPKTAAHRLQTLTARNLTYHFPDSNGHQKGITGINLSLNRGDFVVVTGRIGSGKTTLLRVLLGLLPLDEGKVYWNGEQVANRADFFVPPRAAYTGQVPRLFSDTLQNNILMGLPAAEANVTAALHAAVFEQDLEQLEEGLETMVGPRGVRLSGGQMQRTAAARMFVRRPELFVFDDLSSALDVETEKQLWERMYGVTGTADNGNGIPAAATCLVVSHRRAALQRADHLVVLENGRIADEGTLDELLHRSPQMQQLWSGEGA